MVRQNTMRKESAMLTILVSIAILIALEAMHHRGAFRINL